MLHERIIERNYAKGEIGEKDPCAYTWQSLAYRCGACQGFPRWKVVLISVYLCTMKIGDYLLYNFPHIDRVIIVIKHVADVVS